MVWRLAGQKGASCTAAPTPRGARVDALRGPTPGPPVREPGAGLRISNPERRGTVHSDRQGPQLPSSRLSLPQSRPFCVWVGRAREPC